MNAEVAYFPSAEQRKRRFMASVRFYTRYGVRERSNALMEACYRLAKEIARIEGRSEWDALQGETR